jgi:hypothetical protein
VLLCLKTEIELAFETSCVFKILEDGPSPQKRLSVNFSPALYSLLDFLTSEDGADSLSQNVGMELTLYAEYYSTRPQISHDDLVMQALV